MNCGVKEFWSKGVCHRFPGLFCGNDDCTSPKFLRNFGEVSERLKEHAWKACGRSNTAREFESLPLRLFIEITTVKRIMEFEKMWAKALKHTEIIRARVQALSMSGDTHVPYLLLSES